jgi:plasmid replication initiation protein
MNMMNTQTERITNNLNDLQKKTLQKIKKRLAAEMPKVRIEWARAYSDDIIELHLEYDKHTYKNGLKASTIATEVEAETDVTIILL